MINNKVNKGNIDRRVKTELMTQTSHKNKKMNIRFTVENTYIVYIVPVYANHIPKL